jgi:phosphoribosylglycinamide formyltransferase 1
LSAKIPVGVLISGSGTNLQALMDACDHPDFPARIAVVISNKRSAFGLERARKAGIPAVWIPARKYENRPDHESALSKCLFEHQAEWVACAGYMRLLSDSFVGTWKNRILNIHPTLLPAFPGVDGQGQAHAHGVQIAGVTVHLVDAGCDTGPILAQGATAALPDDDRDALQQRLLKLEHVLFPRTLRWAVEDRIRVEDGRATVSLPDGEARFLWQNPE